ncbi:surface protease GP63 [Trypanosoma theileri]|uniref:Leishmanolysin-like peptidase n=1 Tax=Trypanosoma theileri TaxID=67003 RepID=A0A1X0NL97_9TRYP|nr:surface protease GP63 [Trypanosoma theileri]ORC85351.1 surface protease GP63 [Trypanosoma theileri]
MRRLLLFAPLLLLYCTLVTLAVTEHRCIHDRVMMHVGADFNGDDRLLGMTTVSRHRDSNANSRSSPTLKIREDPSEGWKPIRIKLVTDDLKKGEHYCLDDAKKSEILLHHTYNCSKDDELTPEKKKILVDEILPEAIKLHEERLFVERLKGPIVVPKFSDKSLCSKFTTPTSADKSTEISDYDMVLFAAAVPTPKGTFAWAATCATLGPNGRPVVGIINYGPRYIVATPQRVRVAAHEIAHALGFNFEAMKRKGMVGEVNSLRGKSDVARVTSDNTRREAIDHYKCDSAKGMELSVIRRPLFAARGDSILKGRQMQSRLGTQTAHAGNRRDRSAQLQGPQVRITRPSRPRPQPSTVHAQVASVQYMYDLGETHSNAMDDRLTAMESVGSVVQERRGEEGFSSAKFTQNVHHSSNVLSKRRLLYPQTAMMASEPSIECATENQVKTAKGTTECIVETIQVPRDNMGYSSHWSRRIAKDELMVGLVGAGYYTAITMGAFADLGHYKVNWKMAEQMSWGNNSGCEFLNNKCVNSGETDFPNMFCTAKSGDIPESLQCTSDRQSMGSCSSIGANPVKNDLPVGFRYFSEKKKVGSLPLEQMDYCPFIMAKPGYSCISGEESNNVPGSKIANNSRCVEGNGLTANSAAVGAVCVEVSCKFKKVIVRYSGNNEWHSCHEGENLTVNGSVLQGKIVCPKYADVCNTINKTLDESQGPSKDPDIVEEVQTSLPDGETTTALSDGTQPATEATGTPKPSENDGNQGVTSTVQQSGASTTTEAKPSETKEEDITSFLSGQNNNIIAGKGTDGSFKASAFASVMFVFLTLSMIMAP